MTSPTNRDARERLAAAADRPVSMTADDVYFCTVRQDDLRALLSPDEVEGMGSDQPRPTETGRTLPTTAPCTDGLRTDVSDFMRHSTDISGRRMCAVNVADMAVLLAWVAQFPTRAETVKEDYDRGLMDAFKATQKAPVDALSDDTPPKGGE